MKKLLVGLLTLAAVVTVLPMFAAFEAHVINVTARIENALAVNTSAIDFGTVFPQEHLRKPLEIALSGSFLAEDRVDDVEYFLRQKPKCAITTSDGTQFDPANTATGHIVLGNNPATPEEETYWIDCGPAPRPLIENESWGVLPSLCEYISKEDDQLPNNDGSMVSFHTPWTIVPGDNPATLNVVETSWIDWADTPGHLAKSEQDTVDNWTIDLAVPCFGGHCAQDWADFVHGINPNANPDDYTQELSNQHKIFGCDVWVEVSGISLPGGVACADKADVMLVLDRSGSIGSEGMVTLKNAALAFVTSLGPTADGVHMGQSSFSSTGTLDTHLTSDVTALNAAINALVSAGSTDLEAGITLATTELANPGDGHDRADGESKDYMVIITDGQPNVPNTAQGEADAVAAATAAKAAGIELFVVGVGASVDATFLQGIASGADHYYPVANFYDLSAALMAIASCDENDTLPPLPPPPPARENLLSDNFGTGNSAPDVPGWDRHESATIARAAASGNNSVSPSGGRFVEIAQDSNDPGSENGWICKQVNASNRSALQLSYEWRGDADSTGGDMGLVQYFTGGTCAAPTGGPVLLNSHDSFGGSTSWNTVTNLSLPGALDNSTFLIRFFNQATADGETFRVDNVVLTGLTP